MNTFDEDLAKVIQFLERLAGSHGDKTVTKGKAVLRAAELLKKMRRHGKYPIDTKLLVNPARRKQGMDEAV